jgi:hypothetical protein
MELHPERDPELTQNPDQLTMVFLTLLSPLIL